MIPDSVQSIVEIFTDLIRKKFNPTDGQLAKRENLFNLNVSIAVTSSSTVLDFTTDESYILRIKNSDGVVTARIDAHSAYGARHGLETLFQLTAPRLNSKHR